jgi:hypothetical protein
MPTTECIPQASFKIDGQQRRIVAIADAPDLSSDAGALALRRLDDRLGLTRDVGGVLGDSRAQDRVKHGLPTQLRQRVLQIAMGYEDCNDADYLRDDLLWQTACGTDQPAPLASQPTLSRFENGVSGRELREMWLVLERKYVERLAVDETLVVLDIDATDDPTHGSQQLAFFHGFYDQHMFHPLLVFDGQSGQLISALLRPGRAHASWSAKGLICRLIRAIRARCPAADILLRGDSAFAMPPILERLEALSAELGGVYFVLGLARNPRLEAMAAPLMDDAADSFDERQLHVRAFTWLDYAAKSWPHLRRVVAKAEYGQRGPNPRFLVTNLEGFDAQTVYDHLYCPRGQSENFIKDFKNAIAADRLSCHRFLANAVRLLLHAVAYRLMHELRRQAGALEPALATVQMDTLRLRLLKIAAVVRISVRRVLVRLPMAAPLAALLLRLMT